ncbi:MAG: restriction endonuclease subunit S [Halopseudomonas sabulinigri]
MAGEWRPSNWGDEVTLEYGKAIRGYSRTHGKYRVFGSNGPIGWTSEPLTQGPGVILGRKGAYRGVEFWREPFWVIDTAYYLVPKTELDMRWIYYAVKHYKLGEVDDGSPVPSTTRAAVYMLELDVPPKEEQRAIAHILGTLDDKIELNRLRNQTLEAMARAQFKDWFVDFGPVRAKMEGREPYLPSDLWQLFPDRLDDESKPEGWEISKVETILNRLSAKIRYTKDQVSSHGKTPVFEQGASIILGFHDGDAAYQASAEDPAFVFGDHTCITKLSCQPFDISQNVIPLRGQDRPTMWVYYAINEKQKFEEYRRHWMELITKDLIVAPNHICLEFSKRATGLHIQMEQNERESYTLVQLRDTLLPKLISGELRIKDAERFMEGVSA